MGLMGAIGNGLAEAGGAAANIGMAQIRSAIEEARTKRLAELQSQIKSNEDLTTRSRNKSDAAEERGRVQTEAQALADKRGGFMSQSATDAYNELAKTDPEGAKLGLEAVESAKADGRYKQDPTTRDMLMAQGDIKTIAALDEKGAANEIKTQIAQGRFENAIQIAQVKGEFGMMLGELKAAAANGDGKATELMRNWKYLEGKGWADDKIAQKLLDGKVGEYTTVSEKGYDDKTGKEVTTTRKVRPGDAPKAENNDPLGLRKK